MAVRNIGSLPRHYTVSLPKRAHETKISYSLSVYELFQVI